MKSSIINGIKISTPGRICLFGEHQDYLNLPVISCAISLRISVSGSHRKDSIVHIELPDIGTSDEFSLDGSLAYRTERDYLRSAMNVMRRAGFTFSLGFDCIIRGTIPLNSGTSSSSALVVGWINFLARMSDQKTELSPEEIARLAHQAEVLEFGEPGGMMDQYSTSLGGALFVEFYPKHAIQRLPSQLKSFVLGDSLEQKNTKLVLSHVKNRVLDIVKQISRNHRGFSLHTISLANIDWYLRNLDNEQRDLLVGTIHNRDITLEAIKLFVQPKFDDHKFGELLNQHQSILRDILKISTPKINRMLDAAMNAGAYGGKINGSGGGGCMFAYSPDNSESVAEAINRAGGKAHIVYIDGGTRIEHAERTHE